MTNEDLKEGFKWLKKAIKSGEMDRRMKRHVKSIQKYGETLTTIAQKTSLKLKSNL